MNGFFYIPMKPFRLPSPDPPPIIEYKKAASFRRPSFTFGVDYRVVDLERFREKLQTSRQELRVRRVSLSDAISPPRKFSKPAVSSPARSIEGSEYKVKEVGGQRMYSSKVGITDQVRDMVVLVSYFFQP